MIDKKVLSELVGALPSFRVYYYDGLMPNTLLNVYQHLLGILAVVDLSRW